jgi:hypothetical protein
VHIVGFSSNTSDMHGMNIKLKYIPYLPKYGMRVFPNSSERWDVTLYSNTQRYIHSLWAFLDNWTLWRGRCVSVYLGEYDIWRGSQDSVVGIATHYGLDGLGIESQWGARFTAPVQTGPWAYPASYTMGTFFPGVNRLGRGVDHPPPSSAEVKERVELYLYSPSGPLWPVKGRTLRLL